MSPDLPEDLSGAAGDQTGPLHPEAGPAGLDYEVLRRIGRGGYGEVWLIRDTTGSHLACKVIYRESFDHDRPYEREFDGIKKFEPVSRLDPSQVKILHVGRRDKGGYFYYIMELADDATAGREFDPARYVPRTLRTELTRQGRLPLNECLQIGLSLSAALEHLHRNGLIHRDIKPGNVIFVNGLPKLADIGLVTDADVTISYVGTEGYIPPEGPTSPQADVYGLGKVLYEISTGKDRLDFPDLPTDLGGMPDRQARLEFNSVVARACEASTASRYQSARELHSDLALLQGGGSVRRRRAARRRWRRAAQAAVVVMVLLMVVGAFNYLRRTQPQVSPAGEIPAKVIRIPVPDASLVSRFEREIRESLKSRLTDARSSTKVRVADELFRQSATISEPARELAGLRVAAEVASDAERYDLAMAICDKMAARFELDSLEVKTDLLRNSPPAQNTDNAAHLADAAIATGFIALGADDYERANPLAALAKSAAAASGNSHLAKEAEFLAGEVVRCGAVYPPIGKLKEILRQNPADPAANLAVGQYHCFIKNDWTGGLPMMAHGGDEKLKPALEVELNKKPSHVGDAIAAGDLWWDISTSATNQYKSGYQRRARHWYRIGIARARGAEKAALKQHLAERLQIFPAATAELHFSCRVNGTDHIVLCGDEIRWSSGRSSQNGRLNQVQFDSLKPRSEQVFKNSGATLLLPEDVDFLTARLTIKQMPKQHGRATLELAMDRVHLNIVHSGRGSPLYEVVITFGNAPENPESTPADATDSTEP